MKYLPQTYWCKYINLCICFTCMYGNYSPLLDYRFQNTSWKPRHLLKVRTLRGYHHNEYISYGIPRYFLGELLFCISITYILNIIILLNALWIHSVNHKLLCKFNIIHEKWLSDSETWSTRKRPAPTMTHSAEYIKIMIHFMFL